MLKFYLPKVLTLIRSAIFNVDTEVTDSVEEGQ